MNRLYIHQKVGFVILHLKQYKSHYAMSIADTLYI